MLKYIVFYVVIAAIQQLCIYSPGHRNYFVDLHIVYSGDDTVVLFASNLYRYNESQRIDCGHVLAKNSSEHYHYIRYGAYAFPYFQ